MRWAGALGPKRQRSTPEAVSELEYPIHFQLTDRESRNSLTSNNPLTATYRAYIFFFSSTAIHIHSNIHSFTQPCPTPSALEAMVCTNQQINTHAKHQN